MPEAIEEAAFGDFEPVPGGVMAGLAQVGEHLGEAAGPAEGLWVARRYRRRGLDPTASRMVDFLARVGGVASRTGMPEEAAA